MPLTRTGHWDIWVVDADGGQARNLTQHAASDLYPAWSADGAYLLFVSDRGGNNDVYLMRADGSDLWQLTTSEADEFWPRWRP